MAQSKINIWKEKFLTSDSQIINEIKEFATNIQKKNHLQYLFQELISCVNEYNVDLFISISKIVLATDTSNMWNFYGLMIRNKMIELDNKVSMFRRSIFGCLFNIPNPTTHNCTDL